MDEDTFAKLEAEYCPPLDGALLSAILFDYDLSDKNGIRDAKEILDQLRENATIEEAAGFDPSGTGADGAAGALDKPTGSQTGTGTSVSPDTEDNSISNDFSSLGLGDGFSEVLLPEAHFDDLEGFENLDEDGKVERLHFILPNLSKYSIQHALRKCKGDWDTAISDLLTQSYLAESDEQSPDGEKLRVKGIDGFAEERILPRGRRGKVKSKRTKQLDHRRSSSVPDPGNNSNASTSNRWKSAGDDIDFVASRTGVLPTTVSSLYYKHGASVPRTIAAILKETLEENKLVNGESNIVKTQSDRLSHDFPTIAPNYRAALVRLTYPSIASAHELAKALTTKPKPSPVSGLQIVTRYAQPDGVDSPGSATRKAKSATTSRPPSFDDAAEAAIRLDAYNAARANAYARAIAAHRKAKSNHMMGGAAAYYSQVARDYTARSAAAEADVADAHVAQQSTASQLDLHGVDVVNAVRIAIEGTERWWARLGENRMNGRVGAGERQEGFKIVVGRGTHSVGGKGKLGPAVVKGLREEGWRVEGMGGVLVVWGKARR